MLGGASRGWPRPRAYRGAARTDRLCEVLGERHRWHAVRGHLYELSGDLPAATLAYAEAARRATNVAERDHLVRRAADVRASGGLGPGVKRADCEPLRTGSGRPMCQGRPGGRCRSSC